MYMHMNMHTKYTCILVLPTGATQRMPHLRVARIPFGASAAHTERRKWTNEGVNGWTDAASHYEVIRLPQSSSFLELTTFS